MKKTLVVVLTIALLMSVAGAQNNKKGGAASATPTDKLNPQIQKIVREISAANIEATIRKLVSFGTRHSLSETESDTRGIGAARRWIKSEFERYSRESGGRLQVEFDEFTQPPVARVPKPTQLVNVVATLLGRQPESKDRIYVVSGHYDSCVCAQDVLDGTSDAPGASLVASSKSCAQTHES